MKDSKTEVHKQPPYILVLLKGTQEFLYFGSEYSNNPAHPQYPILQKYWHEFLYEARNHETIAFIEGGERKLHDSLEAAVEQDGEAGWLTWMAHDAHVACRSPEPNDKEMTVELVKQYGEEPVLHYYFVRNVAQWQRYGKPDGYGDYFWFVNKWPEIYGFTGEVSLDRLHIIHKNLTGKPFDKDDHELIYELSNPYESVAKTNEVSKASSLFRDRHIVKQFAQEWQLEKCIFAVYGHSHVVEQEEALHQLLT